MEQEAEDSFTDCNCLALSPSSDKTVIDAVHVMSAVNPIKKLGEIRIIRTGVCSWYSYGLNVPGMNSQRGRDFP